MRLKIDKFNQTNTDPKLLACMIIAIEAERMELACVHGIIDRWWPINILVGLFAVPHELVYLQLDDLPEISIMTATKLYIRGAVNGVVYAVHAKEDARQSSVFVKNPVFCSTKCHTNTSCCKKIQKI